MKPQAEVSVDIASIEHASPGAYGAGFASGFVGRPLSRAPNAAYADGYRLGQEAKAGRAEVPKWASVEKAVDRNAPMPKLDAAIATAIDTRDSAKAAGIADFCRFKLGMNYEETFTRVQQVRPKVTMAEWDALMYEADEGYSKSAPLRKGSEIANTILQQLGGNKFLAMTGAKDITYDANSVTFKLSNPRAAKGVKAITITLNGEDTYDITFYNAKFDVIEEVNGIYNDQLQEVFTNHTGLYTSLGTMGKSAPLRKNAYNDAIYAIQDAVNEWIDKLPEDGEYPEEVDALTAVSFDQKDPSEISRAVTAASEALAKMGDSAMGDKLLSLLDNFQTAESGSVPQDEDVFAEDNDDAPSGYGPFYYQNKVIAQTPEELVAWGKKQGYFPTVWWVSDHGNANVLDFDWNTGKLRGRMASAQRSKGMKKTREQFLARKAALKARRMRKGRKNIAEYSIADHGVDGEQYFQGHSAGEYEDAATGIGNNPYDALEDALESLAQNDWDTESSKELSAEIADAKERFEGKDLVLETMREGADEETLAAIEAWESGDGEYPDTDSHYYVSVNVSSPEYLAGDDEDREPSARRIRKAHMRRGSSSWAMTGKRSILLDTPEDVAWLAEVHTGPLPKGAKSAVLYGNEDSPDHVDVYEKVSPLVDDWPIASYDSDYDSDREPSSRRVRKAQLDYRLRKAGITARDMSEFRAYLRNCTDAQVQGVYDKEKKAGREEYVELAEAEADRRDIMLEKSIAKADYDAFDLHIDMGNDAMQTPEDVAGALKKYASRVEGGDDGRIMDINGNSVGTWEFKLSGKRKSADAQKADPEQTPPPPDLDSALTWKGDPRINDPESPLYQKSKPATEEVEKARPILNPKLDRASQDALRQAHRRADREGKTMRVYFGPPGSGAVPHPDFYTWYVRSEEEGLPEDSAAQLYETVEPRATSATELANGASIASVGSKLRRAASAIEQLKPSLKDDKLALAESVAARLIETEALLPEIVKLANPELAGRVASATEGSKRILSSTPVTLAQAGVALHDAWKDLGEAKAKLPDKIGETIGKAQAIVAGVDADLVRLRGKE